MTDPLADAIREAMFRMPVVTSAGIADAVRAYQSSAGVLPQAARGCGADAGKSSDARGGAAGSPPAPRPLTPDQTEGATP